MKKIIAGLALAAVLSPINVIAEESQEISEEQICGLMSMTAKLTMRNRQSGVPLAAMREMTANLEVPEEVKDMMNSIALLAYERPRYTTESIVDRTITEFENEILIGCLKAD